MTIRENRLDFKDGRLMLGLSHFALPLHRTATAILHAKFAREAESYALSRPVEP